MKIIHTKKDLEIALNQQNNKKEIGLVPTMGALHNGHLSLIKRCRKENDICVVSVFVNPTQFNNKKDFETYPRDVDVDAKLLESVNCDILFAPSASDIYEDSEMNNIFEFDFNGLDKVMEGKNRPGHFNGVVQIVSKLFRLINPTRAYFGEKDFQQVAIIKRMVERMNFNVEIVSCPIVRETSGLALSSRNQLLSDLEKANATEIAKTLKSSISLMTEKTPSEVESWVTETINNSGKGLLVEYYEIVDGHTLKRINSWNDTNSVVGCVTVYCGKVRLIDNIRYK